MAEQDLFPIPSPPPSRTSPSFWPGISPSSTGALRDILKENHEKWHVYFNSMGFHNHIAHRVIASWSLGADESIMKAAYKQDCTYQRPAFKSPEPITIQNFKNHLGDEKYYNAYIKFFTEAVRSKGASATLEEFVFNPKMNFVGGVEKQPEMLNRFLDGLVHPMIHVGYGFEFGLPGMVVEGLASAAVHPGDSSVIITPDLFELTATERTRVVPPATDIHAFSILARILKDGRFDDMDTIDNSIMYKSTMKNYGDILKKYASEWTINISDPKAVERKIEELVWANAMIYGIGGWKEGADFNADFFHMHLVTSSLFLSSLAHELNPTSQELLLRGYFVVCLAWWVARGRPTLDIPGFFAADTAYPTPSGPLPIPSEKTFPSSSSPKAITPNPWLPIIQTTIVHQDDHLPKLQRALAHYGTLYGTRGPGLPDFSGTELPFAEELDGTLFLRASGLTAKRMGRVRDGEEPLIFWDRRGFYKE